MLVKTDDPCDICGGVPTMVPHLEVSLCGVFDAAVCRCQRCGFRQIRPRLGREEISSLYPDAYFDPGAAIGFGDYAREQQRHERAAYLMARRLRRRTTHGRLLEVGCALGFLLNALRRHTGWEVYGCDISPLAADFARRTYGLDVRCATLEEAGFPDETFDFIVQKDVLEHVQSPREHLQVTRRILRPGGLVWLITPNGEANLRPLRDLGRQLERSPSKLLPLLDQGHLSFFTKKNLLRLFEECGFTPVRMRSLGVKRGLRALGYLPRKRKSRRTAPGGRPRDILRNQGNARCESPTLTAQSADVIAAMESVQARLRAGIDGNRKQMRARPFYFYFRQGMKLLDTLPAAVPLGIDYEFLLQRR